MRTKLRDWAVWQARAGCYSQAALPMPLSKPLYYVHTPQTLPEGTRAALPCEARGQEQTVWLRDGVPVLGVEGPRYRLGERNKLEIRGKFKGK